MPWLQSLVEQRSTHELQAVFSVLSHFLPWVTKNRMMRNQTAVENVGVCTVVCVVCVHMSASMWVCAYATVHVLCVHLYSFHCEVSQGSFASAEGWQGSGEAVIMAHRGPETHTNSVACPASCPERMLRFWAALWWKVWNWGFSVLICVPVTCEVSADVSHSFQGRLRESV